MLGPRFVLVALSAIALTHAGFASQPPPPIYSKPHVEVPQPSPAYGYPTQRTTYSQPSQPTYYGPPRQLYVPPPRDLTGDIATVRARISALTTTDKMTNVRLDGLATKVYKVKEYRTDFSDNILPAEQARVKAEDEKIADAAARLRDHAALADEVAALTAKVNNFVAALRRAREVYNSINADINDLVLTERDQQLDISNIAAKERDQKVYLHDLEADDVILNEDLVDAVYASLTDVVNIINAERSETYNVDFPDEDDPVVVIKFATPFTRVPNIKVSTRGFEILEDPSSSYGYGDYSGDARISYKATTDDVTLTRSGNNEGLDPARYYASVTAYVIDNSELEYVPPAHPKPTTAQPSASDYNNGK